MKSLKLLQNRWKEITKKVSIVQAHFILAVFYFLFIVPIGLIMKFLGITERQKVSSLWIEKKVEPQSLINSKKQY